MSRTLKQATVVLTVGAVLFLAFDQFGPWQSGRGWRPRPIETQSTDGTVLRRTVDGHYYVNGEINGRAVVFMIDTGASTVAVGGPLADRLDLRGCRPTLYGTAGGTVRGCEARADTLSVAGLRLHDVRVGVLPDQREDLLLLGMNVLRHFRIETEGGTMLLRPAPR